MRGALLVGLVLRIAAALGGYGPFASDDYRYVLAPAWRWLTQPAAAYGSVIRSPLLARAVWGLFELGEALGLRDPAWLVRFAYVGLGLWSLTAIPGVHRLTRRRLGDNAAMWAAYLTAASALMPRIATRALIEVVAIPFLVWGLVLVDEARTVASAQPRAKDERVLAHLALQGGILLGLATLVRFQLGLVLLCAAVILVWPPRGVGGRPWAWRALLAFGIGAAVALPLQALLDISIDRLPLATPWSYVTFNFHGAAQFGTSPWYTYLLQLVVYTAPPATLVLARPLTRSLQRHVLVSVTLVAFILFHSLIGHKEDRFLFPVLPLLFVGLGAALAETWSGARWQRFGARFFVVVNALALIGLTLSDGQRNLTTPLREVARAGKPTRLVTVGWRDLPTMYLGRDVTVVRVQDAAALLEHVSRAAAPTHILWRHAPEPVVAEQLRVRGVLCDAGEAFAGDVGDRLLVALNAHRNARRLPTTLVRCQATVNRENHRR